MCGRTDLHEGHIEALGDLITQMMRYEPDERPTIDEVFEHRWFGHTELDLWRMPEVEDNHEVLQ